MVKKKKKRSSRAAAVPALGWLVLALVLGIAAQWFLQDHARAPMRLLGEARLVSASAAGWLVNVGWVLMALGGLVLVRQSRLNRHQSMAYEGGRGLPLWFEAAALVLIFSLALFLRTTNLENYPNGGFRDEGENGNVAIQMMNGEKILGTDSKNPAYIEMNTQNAAGYFYPTAVSFKIFGVSITSVRYVAVFFGAMSVLAFYALARLFFGARLAVFLALALCLLRWHLNFSRIGFLGIMTVFLEIPIFYFLMRGLHEREGKSLRKWNVPGLWLAVSLAILRGGLGFFPALRPYEFWLGLLMGIPILIFAWKARNDARSRQLMLAGVALALSMYSYMAARLLILVVLLVVGHHLINQKKIMRPELKKRLWLLFGLLGGGLAVLIQGSAIDAEGAAITTTASKLVMGLGQISLGLGALYLFALIYTERRALKGWVRPVGLTLGVALVVAGPLYSYSLSHMQEVSARSYRVSIYNDEEYDKRPWGAKLKANMPVTMGMYNVIGDGNPRHNLPNEIMLNPAWAILLALGIFLALFRFGEPRHFLILVWWQVSLLGGYLSIEEPQAYRTIGAIPPLLLAMGLVMERAAVGLRKKWGYRWYRLAAPLFLAVIVGGGFYELRTYFVDQPKHPGVWAEFSAAEYMMGRDLKQAQPNTHGLARPDWADSYTFRFMTYPERDFERFELARHVPLRDLGPNQGKNFLYMLGEAELPLADILKTYYPGGEFKEYRHPMNDILLYWTFFVPANEVANAAELKNGLSGLYFQDYPKSSELDTQSDHWVQKNIRKRSTDPFLLFDWTISPVPGFFSAQWSGSIAAPKTGEYMFHVFSNNYVQVKIDGKTAVLKKTHPVGNAWAKGKIKLSKGKHEIRVRYYDNRNYSRLELWWTPPGGKKQIVPASVLFPK